MAATPPPGRRMSRPHRLPLLRRISYRLARRPRFNVSAALFVVLVAAFVLGGIGPARAIVLAFAIASAAFLAMIARMFARSGGIESIRARARREDQGRWGHLLTTIAVCAVVLVALGMELEASKAGGALGIGLAAACLLLSWLFANTMFALHYAHAYYGDDRHRRPRGGLDFPGRADPDYWDFAYFAMVIGMTFQVSDVAITDRRLRRIALVHGVAAFFFNVVIIALSVNIVAGRA
jgi:uncharacterized membrane protein